MTWKRAVLKAWSQLASGEYDPPSGVLFPYGHIVGDVNPPHVKHLFSIPSIAKFKSDLDFLCKRYRPLRLCELERIGNLRGNRKAARYFVLSFDDGLRETYDVIAPILRERGLSAIFFLNSSTVDNRQLMWRHQVSLLIEKAQHEPGRIPPQIRAHSTTDLVAKLKALRTGADGLLDNVARFFEVDFTEYLASARPYLTGVQILELASEGFEFGSHSENHPHFDQIAIEEQKRQIANSVSFIRGLGVPCRYFAFPFHDRGVPASVFNYMKDLDLLLSFGTSEGRLDTIPFSFQRFALDGENIDSDIPELLKQLSTKSFVRHLSRTRIIARR